MIFIIALVFTFIIKRRFPKEVSIATILKRRYVFFVLQKSFFLQEIEIKKQNQATFAFCQYADIKSVVRAMRQMDGEHLGSNRIKLGFGKCMPSRCVWLDGVSEAVTEALLHEQFSIYGTVSSFHIDKKRGQALVFYETVSAICLFTTHLMIW